VERKQSPWKKSRTFGDVYGGRTHLKIPDRIMRRAHSLKPPSQSDTLPLFIVDNPSRDFYFPLTPDEIKKELTDLPRHDWSRITHIWERRSKKTEYETGELPLAEFICGSGVQLIVLYPWPNDLRMPLGKRKPTDKQLSTFAKYSTDLRQAEEYWYLHWNKDAVKNFCIEQLLYHEIGHHVDRSKRHWSKTNRKAVEEFADQYAYERTSKRSMCYQGES
jgi:hypothetical protein